MRREVHLSLQLSLRPLTAAKDEEKFGIEIVVDGVTR